MDLSNFTQLLQNAQSGDQSARDELFGLIDEELRRIAEAVISRKKVPNARATSLVNEVYLKVFREGKDVDLKGKDYFFTVMMDQMNKVLIDRYRYRRRRPESPLEKLSENVLARMEESLPFHFEDMQESSKKLKRSRDKGKARRARMIEMHIIGGLSISKAAKAIGISSAQAHRDKTLAMAELYLDIMRRKEPS